MYTTQVKMPKEIAETYETILLTLQGTLTVTQAAEKLKLSTVQTHNLLNRAMAGIIESLIPQKPGRKPRPEAEQKLREEVERLRRENERLEERVAMIDRVMTVAGGILRGQVRAVRTKKKAKGEGGNEPEEPGGKVAACRQLRETGMSALLAAAMVGVSASTMRRWSSRINKGLSPRRKSGPRKGRELSMVEKQPAIELVRELHGLCGAASIAKATGLSRRQAAKIKHEVTTEMERARVDRCKRLLVTEAGVLRSLDQLYVGSRPQQEIALIASDGSVPYRTSAQLVPGYTAREVARVLRDDFDRNGAPLVVRMDRASCHDAPPVLELLREYEVLLLHGPARYPQFYGQHERQNREHRQWLIAGGAERDIDLEEMLRVLNQRWLRRSLGWRSAATLWNARRPLRTSRRELRHEVVRRMVSLRARLGTSRTAVRLAERLAIEQALEHRGFVRRLQGGW